MMKFFDGKTHSTSRLLTFLSLVSPGFSIAWYILQKVTACFQAAAIRFEVRGGEWRQSFMQMDGEPWKQPLDREYSTFVEITRVPFHSVMIRGE